MSVPEVQKAMAQKHLLITDVEQNEPLRFDEEGLQALRSLDAIIDVQGEQIHDRAIYFILFRL